MGMFDTVLIEKLKLPSPSKDVVSYLKKHNKKLPTEFQTKDIDNVLGIFKINQDGQIFTQIMKPTGKKIKQQPFYTNWRDNRSFLERVYWKFKLNNYSLFSENKKEETLVNELKPVFIKNKLTNTFAIYALENIEGRYVDFEYSITAVGGKVTKIKFVKSTLESESDSKIRLEDKISWDKRFAEQIEKRRAFSSKWYYPIVKETYNPFIFFLRIGVQTACQKLVNWSYKWTGV